jgi:hypothetical protein
LTSSTRSKLARVASLGLAALGLLGCAAAPQLPPNMHADELRAVPFFPQTEYQCGPAALATVLKYAGADVDADALVSEVYVEGLRGSLQPELLGATRRHGLVPYVIAPEPSALAAELAARRPVLVLQNLGVDRVPVWHYAVVVGIEAGEVILRSGTDERRVEPGSRFLRSWRGASNWAFVAVAPGELPATATPDAYVRALAGAELVIGPAAAERGYRAALARWPADPLVQFAAAMQRQAAGAYAEAIVLYREALATAPTLAAARNNLALLLAERGCYAAALTEARTALADVGSDDELRAAVADTVAELERAAALRPAASCQQ